jgi:hypothetical protein
MAATRLPIPTLTPLVLRALRDRAADFGLHAERVEVAYVLNWGGFGTASYHAGDGTNRVHLKLTPDAGDQVGLLHWRAVRAILEDRYHAPAMLGWLTVPGTAYEGPVFEFLDGAPPDGVAMPSVLDELLRATGQLHADHELAEALAPSASPRTHFDCLVSRYTDMLREELNIVRADPPSFINLARLRWLTEQADRLEDLARSSGAISGAARAVIHWDLWWDNVLVSPTGRWHILDWDDVSLGDPALDFATVIFPLTCGPAAHRWQDFPIPAGDGALAARMALYRRAQVLDGVIYVLADWIECRQAPAVTAEVRARKRAEHEHFLRLYEDDYGAG